MQKLREKIAVVTGASKGIGAATAKQLAAAGATVVVNYLSSRDDAERVVKEIVDAGGKAIALGANVALESEVNGLFEEVKAKFGRVDILINNAGVYSFSVLEEVTTDSYRRMYDINVLGVLQVTRSALPLFPEAGGAIVNISSTASVTSPAMASVYASSKSAVDGITRSLAKELGGRNIRVNAINPSLIMTEGVDALANPDLEKQLIAVTPLGRAGQPDDVALPAVFLASEDARFITGVTLLVSGGAGT
ncbi:TPA: SDR family NAD(P)-dependent oxidoreductase [Stenotrophomonas maltophilia]